jgi:hypothetical protein
VLKEYDGSCLFTNFQIIEVRYFNEVCFKRIAIKISTGFYNS